MNNLLHASKFDEEVTITKNAVVDEYKRGGNYLFQAPPGYKFTGEFRVPRVDDFFLTLSLVTAQASMDGGSPRLIMEKIPKRRVVTYTQTGEYRQLVAGEYYLHGDQFREAKFEGTIGAWPVWNKEESEIA